MPAQFEVQYPRLAELGNEEASRRTTLAYFRGIPDHLQSALVPGLARQVYALLEEDLARLDSENWNRFRTKLFQKHQNESPHPVRGYSSLFSTLNEAKGYHLLEQMGCTTIQLIEEGMNSSPDWQAIDSNRCDVLHEVKTILQSNDEVDYVNGNTRLLKQGSSPEVRHVHPEISEGFKAKIRSTIAHAKEQMSDYAKRRKIVGCRQIALLVAELDFDLSSGPRSFHEARQFIEACGDELSLEVTSIFVGLQWPCDEPAEHS